MFALFKTEFLAYKESRIFWFFVILILSLFVKQLFFYSDYVDSKENFQAANSIAQYGDLNCGVNHDAQNPDFTRRTLAYPLLLLLMGKSKVAILLVQVLLLFLSIFLSSALLQFFFPEKNKCKLRNMNLLFYFVHPLIFIYTVSVISEMMLLFLILLFFYVYFLKPGRIILGFVLLVMVLLKPVMVPVWILFMLWEGIRILVFKKWPTQQKIAGKNILFSLIVIPFYLVISLMNKNNTGLFHYCSIGTVNFYGFNARSVLLKKDGVEKADSLYAANEKDFDKMNLSQKLRSMQQFSNKVLQQNFGIYAYIHAKGSVACVLDPGRFEIANFLFLKPSKGWMGLGPHLKSDNRVTVGEWIWVIFFLIVNIVYLLLSILGFYFLIRAKKIAILDAVFLFAWAAFFILVAGPVGSARYLVPALPVILIFSFAGMDKVQTRFKLNFRKFGKENIIDKR